MPEQIGLYIHIPFCVRKCPYCDFYSTPFAEAPADAYTGAVCRALAQSPAAGAPVDTVYFGGGTPALTGARRLEEMLNAVRRAFAVAPDAEITLEANPGAVSAADLQALRACGFTRISFGVQSMHDAELAALGRIHSASQAREAILAAAQAGFVHISADVMLGIPGQTRESLSQTLDALASLPVGHASAYLLKIEDGTPFARDGTAGRCPGEDAAARLYLDCAARLGRHGFAQYEISNFAKPGAWSRHNLKYWRLEPYLGVGPAAHSFFGGERFHFPRDLHAFTAAANPFALAESDGAGGDFAEYAMLRLRLTEGLDLAAARDAYGIEPHTILQKAKPLQGRGLLQTDGLTISLTPEGFLLSNAVIGTLLL